MTRWDLLELRVWTEGFFARAKLDRSVRGWANWIGNGWPTAQVPFDWMPWMRYMTAAPNPIFPLQQQFPRQWWESSRPPTSGVAYTLDDINTLLRPPHGAVIFDPPFDRRTLPDFTYPPGDRGSTATFDQIKDALRDIEVRDPDRGEVLPPDTNHGGDRIPGRYA